MANGGGKARAKWYLREGVRTSTMHGWPLSMFCVMTPCVGGRARAHGQARDRTRG